MPIQWNIYFSVFFELSWYYKPYLRENGEIEDGILERILLEIAR